MKRLNIQKIDPSAYEAMFALEGYLSTTTLTPIEIALVKIRASQINKCSFCIDMHTKEAIKAGETARRIFLLSAWKESELFSIGEKAILAVAEDITLIHNSGLNDKTYENALEIFGEQKLAQIIMAVVTINAWNRIAIATKL